MKFPPDRRRILRVAFVLTTAIASVLIATFVHATLQPDHMVSVAEDLDAGGELGLPTPVEQRRLEVLAELETLRSHGWAGTYFHGDGLGMNVNLVLAPPLVE